MLEAVVLFALGLVLASAGAEALVRGTVRLFGTTVPGLGGTATTLALCIAAIGGHHRELALGTIIGRGAAVLGLTLGLAATTRPLVLNASVVKGGVFLVAVSLALFWLSANDTAMNRDDGQVLLVAFIASAIGVYWVRGSLLTTPRAPKSQAKPLAVVVIVGGVAALVGGAYFVGIGANTMPGATESRLWCLGLTAVAAVATVPDVIAAFGAIRRGDSEAVYVGVISTVLLNLLFVLGITLMANPVRLSNPVAIREVPINVLFGTLLLPSLLNGYRVQRWEGFVMLTAYAAFFGWELSRWK